MEALLAKAGILFSLFGFLGVIGLVVLAAAVIWLVIRVANFDSAIPSLLCVVIALALIVGGLLLSPTPDYQPEPPRPPWEVVLDWAADRLSGFLDRRSEEPSSGDEAAGNGEAADAGDGETETAQTQ